MTFDVAIWGSKAAVAPRLDYSRTVCVSVRGCVRGGGRGRALFVLCLSLVDAIFQLLLPAARPGEGRGPGVGGLEPLGCHHARLQVTPAPLTPSSLPTPTPPSHPCASPPASQPLCLSLLEEFIEFPEHTDTTCLLFLL